MWYLVTGATGFIGGAVAQQLVEAGHQVVTVARNPDKAGDLRALGVEVHKGDITDKESLRAPMTGVDGVFHVAAWYEIGTDSSKAQAINADGTRNVLEMMRELGIPKGVYTSTLAVNSDTGGREVDERYRYDGAHLSAYDQTKWEAHRRVAEPMMQAGLPLVIVMPGLVYGPGDHSNVRTTLLGYLRRNLPPVPSRTAFSWGYIDDIARAHILAMEKGKVGETYIIAGPTHTLTDALATAERITGIPAPKIHLSPAMLKVGSAVMRVVEKLVRVPPLYRSEMLRINAGVTYTGSNAKARRELSYSPRSLEDGLRETLRHEMAMLGMGEKI